jgi:phosphate transport system substrate-binding protein
MKEKELELAKKKGIEVKEYVVARDGICVVVNPKNPVERLALSELKAIFSGSITSWKQVNGEDAPIVVLSRDVNSGTHIYFKEYVLEGAEYIESALLMPSSQAVADEVAQNENAIGYYGIGYLSPAQKAVAVAKDRGSLYVKPTIETVRSGRYCISRPLFFYTPGEPEGKTKKFLEFVLSEKGQRIVREQDFVPVR